MARSLTFEEAREWAELLLSNPDIQCTGEMIKVDAETGEHVRACAVGAMFEWRYARPSVELPGRWLDYDSFLDITDKNDDGWSFEEIAFYIVEKHSHILLHED